MIYSTIITLFSFDKQKNKQTKTRRITSHRKQIRLFPLIVLSIAQRLCSVPHKRILYWQNTNKSKQYQGPKRQNSISTRNEDWLSLQRVFEIPWETPYYQFRDALFWQRWTKLSKNINKHWHTQKWPFQIAAALHL